MNNLFAKALGTPQENTIKTTSNNGYKFSYQQSSQRTVNVAKTSSGSCSIGVSQPTAPDSDAGWWELRLAALNAYINNNC